MQEIFTKNGKEKEHMCGSGLLLKVHMSLESQHAKSTNMR